MRLGLAIGVLAVAAATPVLAAESASQNVSTSAQIVQPITLGKASDLAFGSIAKPSAGGNTITVDEVSGARSLSGGGDASLAASTASRAAYTVGGEGGQAFSISVPGTLNMVRAGGSETLQVVLVSSATSGTLSGSIGAAGTASFGVGGRITISKATPSGAYSGSFEVSVAYD
jgi:hypothetical protein